MRPGWKTCWPIWSDPKGQTFFIWRRALGGCAPNFAIYNSLYNFARKMYKKNVKSGIPDLTSPARLDQLAYILPLEGGLRWDSNPRLTEWGISLVKEGSQTLRPANPSSCYLGRIVPTRGRLASLVWSSFRGLWAYPLAVII